jgi:hypothetical protein
MAGPRLHRRDNKQIETMKTTYKRNYIVITLLAAAAFNTIARAADPLPSWNEGAAKKAIIAFVEKVTKEGSPDFVPVAERIATFGCWQNHLSHSLSRLRVRRFTSSARSVRRRRNSRNGI